jgi:hypothetical protein
MTQQDKQTNRDRQNKQKNRIGRIASGRMGRIKKDENKIE